MRSAAAQGSTPVWGGRTHRTAWKSNFGEFTFRDCLIIPEKLHTADSQARAERAKKDRSGAIRATERGRSRVLQRFIRQSQKVYSRKFAARKQRPSNTKKSPFGVGASLSQTAHLRLDLLLELGGDPKNKERRER